MRGDLALDARLALRFDGMLGVLALLGGASAAGASYLPWYQVRATVTMLGDNQTGQVATLAGWEAHPWGWVAPVAGLVAVAIGLTVAVDRSPPNAAGLLLGTGLVLASAVAVAGMVFPAVDRFDTAGSRLRELTGVADRLPQDVEMALAISPAAGVWITLGAAVAVIGAGSLIRARR